MWPKIHLQCRDDLAHHLDAPK
jgi:hypothetical protein